MRPSREYAGMGNPWQEKAHTQLLQLLPRLDHVQAMSSQDTHLQFHPREGPGPSINTESETILLRCIGFLVGSLLVYVVEWSLFCEDIFAACMLSAY